MPSFIRLRGVTGPFKGRLWESAGPARVGRHHALEVVLDDDSVSRRHAELHVEGASWALSDPGSTNGTWINGARAGVCPIPVHSHDLLQFGEVSLVVEGLRAGHPEGPEPGRLHVEGTTRLRWDNAAHGIPFDTHRRPRPGQQMLAMLRAGHHLGNCDEDALLRCILDDAVAVLDAQRGSIILAESPTAELSPRTVAIGRSQGYRTACGHACSKNLARRSLERGESILCQHAGDDRDLGGAVSIAEGAMASVLCVLLRTPRKRLGVLHLDRGPGQRPFTMADLHLADALAANVSAGIESAGLLRQRRDFFLNTVGVLAQLVELRDEYTGGHTARVTAYSVLLARELGVTAAELDLIRLGGPLHDVGKIGIDDAILRKTERLNDEEFEIMKQHAVLGAGIVASVPELLPILPIVRHHHERWDGDGYPDGLRGDSIPYTARIVAVADTFDAMTSDRPYRKGFPAEVAFAKLKQEAGRQLDPVCVASFLRIRESILEAMHSTARAPTAVIARELRACLAASL